MTIQQNHLKNEISPYLLHHSSNPIDWYPWGIEALEKSKRENKPLFISIGYSTCHWCHVMAKESFENKEVAYLLNNYYVPIKVDKEERPDIDNIYMTCCQMITGQGGWPLTVFAMPDQKPFFIGTYFPLSTQYGHLGLLDLLNKFINEWENDYKKLENNSENVYENMRYYRNLLSDNKNIFFSKEIFKKSFSFFKNDFDKKFGGFGNAPKFPSGHNLLFLMRYSYFEENTEALSMVENTLENMYKGGIFDHIGGGFARYSTDEKWFAPHFEKMLCDNALLAITYLECYQITKKPLYKDIADSIFDFVVRELTGTSGQFYTALDADVNGIEGKYYTFCYDEIIDLLGEKEGRYFCEKLNIFISGNFHKKNIPNMIGCFDMEKNERLMLLIQKVYHYRKKRYKLNIDDKILVSNNAFMIIALTKGSQILQNKGYLLLAKKSIDFIEENLIDDEGNIYASFCNKRSLTLGNIDDYAYYCLCLINMYEATFEVKYLKRSLFIFYKIQEKFADISGGGYFLNDKKNDNLIYRPKENFDGAIPCGNSVMGFVFDKLSKLSADEKIINEANRHFHYLEKISCKNPNAYSFALCSLMNQYYPSKEIVAIVQEQSDLESIKNLQREFSPNLTLMAKIIGKEDPSALASFIKDYNIKDEKATFYVCENNKCFLTNKIE